MPSSPPSSPTYHLKSCLPPFKHQQRLSLPVCPDSESLACLSAFLLLQAQIQGPVLDSLCLTVCPVNTRPVSYAGLCLPPSASVLPHQTQIREKRLP